MILVGLCLVAIAMALVGIMVGRVADELKQIRIMLTWYMDTIVKHHRVTAE